MRMVQLTENEAASKLLALPLPFLLVSNSQSATQQGWEV